LNFYTLAERILQWQILSKVKLSKANPKKKLLVRVESTLWEPTNLTWAVQV